MLDESGFKNSKIAMPQSQVLENIQAVQRRQNLPISTSLVSNKICPINLDIEMEIKQKNGIKRVIRKLGKNDNLFDKSEGLNQYKGFVIADIDALKDTVSFTNGEELKAGEVTGDVNESALRRIQIREAIKAHFEKEQVLFNQGIKVLSLFFIDEVARYRRYDENGEIPGEYAQIFLGGLHSSDYPLLPVQGPAQRYIAD